MAGEIQHAGIMRQYITCHSGVEHALRVFANLGGFGRCEVGVNDAVVPVSVEQPQQAVLPHAYVGSQVRIRAGQKIENGRIVLEGTPDALRRDDRVRSAYLGI